MKITIVSEETIQGIRFAEQKKFVLINGISIITHEKSIGDQSYVYKKICLNWSKTIIDESITTQMDNAAFNKFQVEWDAKWRPITGNNEILEFLNSR